ncbi:hypothetical protein NYO91_09430 [Arhodomonas aquaeolei]|uniref:hypothetical protein n=1 Tax=Arhodomonas aquaeolei TaxID=2369 RepID=UPI00216707E7|nr:hypothetical protein [Arhodomonas aquaeolei]MCS4504297.1 hypothetical protein [Arhodomonas aquaeolei]
MRMIVRFIIVICMLTVAGPSPAAKWMTKTMDDAMYDTVYLVFQPFNSEYRRQDMGVTGVLGVQCKNGDLEVFVVSGIPFTGMTPRIQYRIDDSDPQESVWQSGNTGTLDYVGYPGNDVRLFHNMMNGGDIVLRMSRFRVGTETHTLSLQGLTKASKKVREACDI